MKLLNNIPSDSSERHHKERSRKLFPPVGLVLILILISLSVSLAPNSADDSQNDAQKQRVTTTSQLAADRALELVRDWALRIGREIHQGTQEATCQRSIRNQFDPAKLDQARRGPYRASVVSIDWTRQHAETVRTISTTMGWHENALRAIVQAAESLASNHTYDENLPNVEYVDVHRLHDESTTDEHELSLDNSPDQQSPEFNQQEAVGGAMTPIGDSQAGNAPTDPDPDQILADQQPGRFARGATTDEPQALVLQPAGTPMPQDETQGEWQTPIKSLKLSRNKNFGDLPVSTETSAVHVPVHIYPGQPAVKNAIAWSEQLTRVFQNNLVQNPRLTNQYFASPLGFMRLFPAQKWPIARNDPDLFDARMRPWYVAGASSRKDVVILVDASGSMTGSRRDIAKGVVFEILDTLTDNDHFVVLRFNDYVHQVGVPSCPKMRSQRARPKIPLKNTISMVTNSPMATDSLPDAASIEAEAASGNGTDLDALYLLPATGRNVRHVKTNFTIPTAGIANFSHALVTAFELLQRYQENEWRGSQCNQAIMLITDGSPSDFEHIFNRYNYPNAPVRVFTYLIGRETGDGTHTKMMACHNRGFYTHVINLAEVRETVQHYINVMARPLVLNRTHPITWTPPYGELTYQLLTDWIWESRRRERARTMLAASQRGGATAIHVTSEDLDVAPPSASAANYPDNAYDGTPMMGSAGDGGGSSPEDAATHLEALDLFGYESNPDCFWELHRNDLTSTVVQPVYDSHNDSLVVEKYLSKNTWVRKEQRMRTANLLGVAGVDLKINNIINLAANSYKMGPNGYPILLTNNGLVMHHPDLRSILEPLTSDPSERHSRILKPFFASLDLVQLEHILQMNGSALPVATQDDENFIALRNEAVAGKTGWRELNTKRTIDCQRRVQTRHQSFYYKPLEQFPFVFMHAVPQPYGSYKLEAQVEIKSSSLPEKLTTYFTTSDFDLWNVHPDYNYCEGPSNNTVTTLLDMFQRLEEGKLNEVEWLPAESSKPPILIPDKIYCDKELVQSLVYDAVATFSFSEDCGPPAGRDNDESSLMGMFGVRFSFVATRSGLTRVRHQSGDDPLMKREALAFAKLHARAMDETFYKRTVDYNMLMNDTATLLQVPFNTHQKIRERLNKLELDSAAYDETGPMGYNNADATANISLDADRNDEQFFAGSRLSVKDMNLYEKLELLANSSIHVIATESLIVNEGAQRAVAGVSGVFYDYATFVMRFLNSTNAKFAGQSSGGGQFKKPARCYLNPVPGDEICSEEQLERSLQPINCGHTNDTIDCLLIDNNGYILISERLELIGRHLKAFSTEIMQRLVETGLFHEVQVSDHQSICVSNEEKQTTAGSASSASSVSMGHLFVTSASSILINLLQSLAYTWSSLVALGLLLMELAQASFISTGPPVAAPLISMGQQQQQQQSFQALSAMLPKKSYLRPCDKTLTRYETRPRGPTGSERAEFLVGGRCACAGGWFVYEQVANTNLIMLVVDSGAKSAQCTAHECVEPATSGDQSHDDDESQSVILDQDANQICSMLERDSKLQRRRLESCISHHADEEQIKLCGSATRLARVPDLLASLLICFCTLLLSGFLTSLVGCGQDASAWKLHSTGNRMAQF